MKKIMIYALTALLSAALVTGCSSKDEPDVKEENSSSVSEAETEPATTPEIPTQPHDIHPTDGTYVYDDAGVLEKESFDACNNYAGWLYENCLINAAVVTAGDLGGAAPSDYAAKAYNDIYEGKGSGLLLLINNDTNEDYLYKTGSCAASIDAEAEKLAFYWATRDIVTGDYEKAILRLLQLGESCSQTVFDNVGAFSAEDIAAITESCGDGISVLATSNTSSSPNEEICQTYCDRKYANAENGAMIMLDTSSKKLVVSTKGAAAKPSDAALKEADAAAAKGSYIEAVTKLAEAMKG